MKIAVDCRGTGESWLCHVTIGDDPGATNHAVTVSGETVRELAAGEAEPTRLVEESFRFLLEREPRESILRTFELPLIGRYFPEYEDQIRRRLAQ